MKSEIVFGDEKLKEVFEKLKNSKTEDKQLYDSLVEAFEQLEKDAFSGIQIQKKVIPKEYIKKYGPLDNLWKFNLPKGWRLIFQKAYIP